MSLLTAAALGALAVLAFAPFAWAWSLPVVLAALLALAASCPPRRAAALGYAFGCGLFGAGTWWVYISMHGFGGAPWPLALALTLALTALLAAFPAAALGLTQTLVPAGRPAVLPRVLAFAGSWVLLEWLRGWFASGFPWLALGYAATPTVLAGYAPLLGVFGASLIWTLLGGCLWGLTRRRWWPAPAALVLVGLGAGLQGVTWTQPTAEPLRVALLQGNVGQGQKWDPAQVLPTLQRYRELNRRAGAADLIVWPEVAVPVPYERLQGYFGQLQAERRPGQTLLIGVLRPAPAGGYHNSVLALDEGPHRFYDKVHLVPFGEYFPVPGFVRTQLALLDLPYTDMAFGARAQPPLAVDGQAVAVSICYEDLFGDELAAAAGAATLLVNVSNDAWFGDSIAPHQHLQIAQTRALEFAKPLLRATNTGITALVDHRGRVQARLPQFELDMLAGRVQPRRGATPYARVGDLPAVMGSLLLAVLAFGSARRRG